MFDVNLSKFGNDVCLITEDKKYTYNEVDLVSTSIANVLKESKNLVILKAKTNVETIIGYLSFFKTNQSFIMLDAHVDTDFIESITDTYQPNYIWEERVEDTEYLVNFLSYGLRTYNTEKVLLHPDLSLMLSTSGTTGSPKMVKLTKENLYSNCNSIVEYLNIQKDHRAITNLPLYYSYGISILNTHLMKGASIVVTDKSIISKEFWDIFKKNRVTTLNGVPYNYEILRRIGLMKMDLPSLKYLTQAGGKLNNKLVTEFAVWARENRIKFFVMYGQTEATARISYLPIDKTLEKDKSIGISIPNGKLFIKNLNSNEIIKDNFIDGELLYHGANVMMGYATKLEDLKKDDELHSILHTGDIAHKDEEGYYYITGRLKRFIKIHGNRVGLDEIEQFLKSKAYDILCTGIDNKLMIATLNEAEIENIKKDIINKYSFHHSVVKVKIVDKYPITSAGKIQYKELIKVFQ